MKKLLLSLLMLCGVTAAWAVSVGDGSYTAATMKELTDAIGSGTSTARIKLTADIYMSDLGEGDAGRHTLCSTFKGTLDGDGHTIWAARPEVTHDGGGHYHRQYLFTYCDGATIKNVTFKDFRVQSEDNPNQAIITSKAMNGCVFENITLDHVSVFCNKDNVGAVTGWADNNCTFKDITVKNSDFTTDMTQSGAVVAHAINCTFTNIKVENCESTSDDGKSGGVAGRTDGGTINNVEILGAFIKTNSEYGGGVVGYSENTHFKDCIVDDQSCVCVDGGPFIGASAGGVVGDAEECEFRNCINSALIASDDDIAGGIVGYGYSSDIVGCLNTGMVISIGMDDVKSSFYNKYKNKTGMTCVTKTYQGKEHVIRKYEGDLTGNYKFGGIAGMIRSCNFSKCVNFGSVYTKYGKTSGIVGSIHGGTISDCLSDFSGNECIGICFIEEYNVSVNNCLNLTTYKDISANDWRGVSGEHNYSLTTAEDAKYTTKTTAAKIKSGEICHLLGEAWEQNIGTDAYPTPTGSKKGVYHTRTVSNQYGTVCLPFSVKSDDKISYYSLSRKEEDGQDIKLLFTYVETVNAGWPVLYRAAEAKDATANNPVELCFNNAGEGFSLNPLGNIGGFWELYGTFEQKVFDETTDVSSKNIYYVSDGKIRNAKKTTIAPYRAWIYGENIDDLTGSSAQAKAIKLVLAGENGETTALELVGEDLAPVQQGAKSYSLMGTEVGDGYRGLVIRNGKKVIQNR